MLSSTNTRWLALLLLWCVLAARAQPLQLGEVQFPTSAASKEAQAHFLRGLAALHSFWYPVALEEFQAATRVEPRFAMGHWGAAMTRNHPIWGDPQDTEAGRAALRRIQPDFAASERERAYIDAVRLLYGEGEKPARDKAYAQAMARLHEQYPQDAEAALFHALALMGTGSERARLRAGEIAMRVFREKPNHPGAAHYVIHAYDDPQHARLALPAARRYAEIAPAAPHALHMPSHIFLQLGVWPEAAESNERARTADPMDFHSLHWLCYVYLQQGRYREAEGLLDTMRGLLARYPKDDVARLMYAAYTRATMAATYLIETEQWERAQEILGSPASAGAPSGEAQAYSAIAEIPATFARGMAAAMTGSPGAEEAAKALRSLQAPPGAEKFPFIADLLAAARIQSTLIDAAQAAERKKFGAALKAARVAIAAADKSETPPGPPVLIKPPQELLGEILLQDGRPGEAARHFATVLARHDDRARALLGAARAAAADGHPGKAEDFYARLVEQWRGADAAIPELAEAQQERDNSASAGSSRQR